MEKAQVVQETVYFEHPREQPGQISHTANLSTSQRSLGINMELKWTISCS